MLFCSPSRIGFVLSVLVSSSVAGVRAQVCPGCPEPLGDVTGDDVTNVVDVQCTINGALWALAGANPPAPICAVPGPEVSDLNLDGAIDVTDVSLGIQIALGIPLAIEIDGDGDGCPDACEAPGGPGGTPTWAECRLDHLASELPPDLAAVCDEAYQAPAPEDADGIAHLYGVRGVVMTALHRRPTSRTTSR